MEIEYNAVPLQMTEIQSIKRTAVWDDSFMSLLHILWEIGVVAVYAPNGFPPATAVLSTASTETGFGGDVVGGTSRPVGTGGVFTQFFQRIRSLIFGRDVTLPNPPVRRAQPAFAADPDGVANPALRGYGPILTDAMLRNRLMTPRAPLRITGYDWRTGNKETLIESPKAGYVCDPILGPHPIACDILSGEDQSFAVFFQVQTATLPCADGSDRLVLSHTWQMTHTHDEDQYLTRIIDGEITFNGSMIHSLGINPDAFRAQFFHPIPPGCYRTIPFVTPSTDGLTYKYRTEDHDQTIMFDAGDSGATRIEIAEKLSYYQPWTPSYYSDKK